MKGQSGHPSLTWCSYQKTNLHSDSQCHKINVLKHLAARFADLRSTDQARLADIGSAHQAQTSQPDPPTFGFSFSALGASLVEAAASFTISGSTPANFSAKPAAPETRSLQLASVPSDTSQQNRRMPEGIFSAFMTTTAALSAASLCSGDLTLTMREWIAERLTIVSTRYSLPGCKTW